MASAIATIRTENSHRIEGDELSYQCDCGEEYISEDTLKRHQLNSCKHRSYKCSFCDQIFPSSSSAALREHLMLCGNKTDPCPKCRELIRRSHFVYHYENNCASINQIETPPSRRKLEPTNHSVANANRPILRIDVPIERNKENYVNQNDSVHASRINSPTMLLVPNRRSTPTIVECEFCHNECAKIDYKIHQKNCLQNPTIVNNIRRKSPLSKMRTPKSEYVCVPCEICKQEIDAPNWSRHMRYCKEKEKKILMTHAVTTHQSVSDLLPCEFCQEPITSQKLMLHQRKCSEIFHNTETAARLADSERKNHLRLPIKPNSNKENDITLKPGRNAQSSRIVHYQTIDIDETREANRSSSNLVNSNQHPLSRSASNDPIEPKILLGRVQSNENSKISKTERLINNSSNRAKSFEDLMESGPNHATNHGYSDNDDRRISSSHNGKQKKPKIEIIDNHPDRQPIKKKKTSFFKRFFCGTVDDYASD